MNVVAVQETHLTADLERSFQLYAQNFEFWFSHGTSQSGGVLIAVRRNCGLTCSKVSEIPGYILQLNIDFQGESTKVINVYGHPDYRIRWDHFQWLERNVIGHNIILLGDFNSVCSTADRKPGRLDPTSLQLCEVLSALGVSELEGTRTYTYQHQSLVDRKSRLDRIYVSKEWLGKFYTYSQWWSGSDHCAIVMHKKSEDRGPSQWRLP